MSFQHKEGYNAATNCCNVYLKLCGVFIVEKKSNVIDKAYCNISMKSKSEFLLLYTVIHQEYWGRN